MKVPFAKARMKKLFFGPKGAKEAPQTFLAEAPRFGIDWPPYGYWTDEELAEMSRPRRNFNHDNRSI
jgi:hypothetical protein